MKERIINKIYFLANVLFNIVAIGGPILLWMDIFYDPFFPTSSYLLLGEKQILSQSFVVEHAEPIFRYYPFSIYLIGILSSVSGIQFLHIGYIPVTFFLHALLFLVIVDNFLKKGVILQNRWSVTLKFIFLSSLLAFIHTYAPLFYITLGSTALIASIYFLIISKVKNNELWLRKTPEYFIIFLFAILTMFSYYTSGALVILTLIVFLSMKILYGIVYRYKSGIVKSVLLTITLSVIYLSFDRIFYSELPTIWLSLGDIIVLFLQRHTVFQPIEYLYFPPEIILFLQRINMFLFISLLFVLIVFMINKFFTKVNNLYKNIDEDIITLLFSFVVSCIFQSIIYTYLMGKFYLLSRYLFVAPFIISLIFVRSTPKKTMTKVYLILVIIYSLLNFILFMYTLIDIKILSPKTSYMSFSDSQVVCQFLFFSNIGFNCFADLKTSFTLPYLCPDTYIRFRPFEHSMFQVYNDYLNTLVPTKDGLYIYSARYSQLGILMTGWIHVKPFHFIANALRIFDDNKVVIYFVP